MIKNKNVKNLPALGDDRNEESVAVRHRHWSSWTTYFCEAEIKGQLVEALADS